MVSKKHFEVRHTFNGEKFVVNLDNKVCSCRRWSITGLPYYHSLACNQISKFRWRRLHPTML